MRTAQKAVERYLSLTEMIAAIDPEKLILVEGSKDLAALRSLGIENAILPLNREPLFKVVEACMRTGKEVLLLTDLDAEGEKLSRTLRHDLCRHGVNIDISFREYVRTATPVQVIEDLRAYYHSLEKMCPERFTFS